MGMTQASSEYFNRVAGEWDTIRSGYFSEAVRETAIAKAYLRGDMVAADVGAGTGFVAAGLAPLVKRVFVLDGSPAMIEVARKNLAQYTNVEYRLAESQSLPLEDASVDTVFANMYLHHCPDPLAAIREMARIVKPGGRVILTDMDAHPYAWLKEEMADVWQGFERSQVLAWYEEAGLVNRLADCTGQSCCAESEKQFITGKSNEKAEISIFVAAATRPVAEVKARVVENYTEAVENTPSSCCTPDTSVTLSQGSCCGSESAAVIEDQTNHLGYKVKELSEIPTEAQEISFGCGNPVAIAGLKPGEVVLDIGSGGGIDAFLAARKVGETGRVIGVDMTPVMLERARQSAEKGGFSQVEFRFGHAENLPIEDAQVDVILSNCVINLCADKGRVFAEAYRALKEGGRLEVSDVVTSTSFPAELRNNLDEWSSCVSGALPEGEYLDLIRQAGFKGIRTRRSKAWGESGGTKVYSLLVSAVKGEPKERHYQLVDDGWSMAPSCGCGSN